MPHPPNFRQMAVASFISENIEKLEYLINDLARLLFIQVWDGEVFAYTVVSDQLA